MVVDRITSSIYHHLYNEFLFALIDKYNFMDKVLKFAFIGPALWLEIHVLLSRPSLSLVPL